MSECDEEEEHDDWEDPEEQPLVIAGKSFTELLEDQLLHDGEVVSINTTKGSHQVRKNMKWMEISIPRGGVKTSGSIP